MYESVYVCRAPYKSDDVGIFGFIRGRGRLLCIITWIQASEQVCMYVSK